MSKNILVAVAWPYASGSRHLGHIGGAYLPADIFARMVKFYNLEIFSMQLEW